MSSPRDRDGRNVIHEGDTVSVFPPVTDHDGVGTAGRIGRRLVTVTDSQGREWRGYTSDVSVDWTAYPAE